MENITLILDIVLAIMLAAGFLKYWIRGNGEALVYIFVAAALLTRLFLVLHF